MGRGSASNKLLFASFLLYHDAFKAIIVENVLTNIANSIYSDQTDRIGSVGYVSTLIEPILSTEWKCLKIKLACTKQSRF